MRNWNGTCGCWIKPQVIVHFTLRYRDFDWDFNLDMNFLTFSWPYFCLFQFVLKITNSLVRFRKITHFFSIYWYIKMIKEKGEGLNFEEKTNNSLKLHLWLEKVNKNPMWYNSQKQKETKWNRDNFKNLINLSKLIVKIK